MTGVEIELCKSFLPNFAGTVKFVAKMSVGMGSLCIFGVVQDWYCLIGTLVIWHGCLTCVFIANTLYVACIYMYVSTCVFICGIYLPICWSYVFMCYVHVPSVEHNPVTCGR